jgi:hypothetical protein
VVFLVELTKIIKSSRLSLKYQLCIQFKFIEQCIEEEFTLFILYFDLPFIAMGLLIFHSS